MQTAFHPTRRTRLAHALDQGRQFERDAIPAPAREAVPTREAGLLLLRKYVDAAPRTQGHDRVKGDSIHPAALVLLPLEVVIAAHQALALDHLLESAAHGTLAVCQGLHPAARLVGTLEVLPHVVQILHHVAAQALPVRHHVVYQEARLRRRVSRLVVVATVLLQRGPHHLREGEGTPALLDLHLLRRGEGTRALSRRPLHEIEGGTRVLSLRLPHRKRKSGIREIRDREWHLYKLKGQTVIYCIGKLVSGVQDMGVGKHMESSAYSIVIPD
jgi:hypothetical protein